MVSGCEGEMAWVCLVLAEAGRSRAAAVVDPFRRRCHDGQRRAAFMGTTLHSHGHRLCRLDGHRTVRMVSIALSVAGIVELKIA
jgi:hypothetical protein